MPAATTTTTTTTTLTVAVIGWVRVTASLTPLRGAHGHAALALGALRLLEPAAALLGHHLPSPDRETVTEAHVTDTIAAPPTVLVRAGMALYGPALPPASTAGVQAALQVAVPASVSGGVGESPFPCQATPTAWTYSYPLRLAAESAAAAGAATAAAAAGGGDASLPPPPAPACAGAATSVAPLLRFSREQAVFVCGGRAHAARIAVWASTANAGAAVGPEVLLGEALLPLLPHPPAEPVWLPVTRRVRLRLPTAANTKAGQDSATDAADDADTVAEAEAEAEADTPALAQHLCEAYTPRVGVGSSFARRLPPAPPQAQEGLPAPGSGMAACETITDCSRRRPAFAIVTVVVAQIAVTAELRTAATEADPTLRALLYSPGATASLTERIRHRGALWSAGRADALARTALALPSAAAAAAAAAAVPAVHSAAPAATSPVVPVLTRPGRSPRAVAAATTGASACVGVGVRALTAGSTGSAVAAPTSPVPGAVVSSILSGPGTAAAAGAVAEAHAVAALMRDQHLVSLSFGPGKQQQHQHSSASPAATAAPASGAVFASAHWVHALPTPAARALGARLAALTASLPGFPCPELAPVADAALAALDALPVARFGPLCDVGESLLDRNTPYAETVVFCYLAARAFSARAAAVVRSRGDGQARRLADAGLATAVGAPARLPALGLDPRGCGTGSFAERTLTLADAHACAGANAGAAADPLSAVVVGALSPATLDALSGPVPAAAAGASMGAAAAAGRRVVTSSLAGTAGVTLTVDGSTFAVPVASPLASPTAATVAAAAGGSANGAKGGVALLPLALVSSPVDSGAATGAALSTSAIVASAWSALTSLPGSLRALLAAAPEVILLPTFAPVALGWLPALPLHAPPLAPGARPPTAMRAAPVFPLWLSEVPVLAPPSGAPTDPEALFLRSVDAAATAVLDEAAALGLCAPSAARATAAIVAAVASGSAGVGAGSGALVGSTGVTTPVPYTPALDGAVASPLLLPAPLPHTSASANSSSSAGVSLDTTMPAATGVVLPSPRVPASASGAVNASSASSSSSSSSFTAAASHAADSPMTPAVLTPHLLSLSVPALSLMSSHSASSAAAAAAAVAAALPVLPPDAALALARGRACAALTSGHSAAPALDVSLTEALALAAVRALTEPPARALGSGGAGAGVTDRARALLSALTGSTSAELALTTPSLALAVSPVAVSPPPLRPALPALPVQLLPAPALLPALWGQLGSSVRALRARPGLFSTSLALRAPLLRRLLRRAARLPTGQTALRTRGASLSDSLSSLTPPRWAVEALLCDIVAAATTAMPAAAAAAIAAVTAAGGSGVGGSGSGGGGGLLADGSVRHAVTLSLLNPAASTSAAAGAPPLAAAAAAAAALAPPLLRAGTAGAAGVPLHTATSSQKDFLQDSPAPSQLLPSSSLQPPLLTLSSSSSSSSSASPSAVPVTVSAALAVSAATTRGWARLLAENLAPGSPLTFKLVRRVAAHPTPAAAAAAAAAATPAPGAGPGTISAAAAAVASAVSPSSSAASASAGVRGLTFHGPWRGGVGVECTATVVTALEAAREWLLRNAAAAATELAAETAAASAATIAGAAVGATSGAAAGAAAVADTSAAGPAAAAVGGDGAAASAGAEVWPWACALPEPLLRAVVIAAASELAAPSSPQAPAVQSQAQPQALPLSLVIAPLSAPGLPRTPADVTVSVGGAACGDDGDDLEVEAALVDVVAADAGVVPRVLTHGDVDVLRLRDAGNMYG
jgi:hypothetical protein